MNDIRLTHIRKSYGPVEAVKEVDLSVSPGELFGLIGPDGAGKTTIFRILTTLLIPDAGTASVCGYDTVRDYKTIRNLIGYMPGRFSLYQDLSVEENLNFFATVFHTTVAENYDLIKDIYIQIEPFKTRRAGKLSGGMKQKLALCCALIHRPSVLFLDEPTTGVDPVSRNELWNMLGNLKKQGITLFVSTPYMDEASRCDRIALIQNGALLSVDTPANISSSFSRPLWKVKAGDMHRLLADLRAWPLAYSCYAFGDTHHLTLTQEVEKGILCDYLRAKGHIDIEVDTALPGIDDSFMALLGDHVK